MIVHLVVEIHGASIVVLSFYSFQVPKDQMIKLVFVTELNA